MMSGTNFMLLHTRFFIGPGLVLFVSLLFFSPLIFCFKRFSHLFPSSVVISTSRDVTAHLWVGVGAGISCSRR